MPLTLWLLAACSDPPPAAPDAPPQQVAQQEEAAPRVADAPNAAPRITGVTLSPRSPTASEDLSVEVTATDPDGDRVDVDVVWVINDQPQIDQTAETLSHTLFRKGDRIAVQAKASDDEHEVEQTSPTITIQNAPPLFITDPRTVKQLDGLRLEGQDPDGDSLSWSISGAPKGMSIDPAKGVIHYAGSSDEPGGSYRIRVQLSDGDGGKAEWEAGIDIQPGSAVKK